MRQICIFVIIALILAGCASPAPASTPTDLVVFAASSLTEAFTALGQEFEADPPPALPNVRVTFNFAGSQQLAQQLAQGAPADIFASANQAQMNTVVTDGRIASDAPRIFAQNRLILVMPEDNPGQIQTLADLTQPGLRLVLADESVPVGAYSRVFLLHADESADLPDNFSQGMLANTVSFEVNVRAVLSKVRLGEADAGIVYASDLAGANMDGVISLAIPDALNVTANYPIAPLTDAMHAEAAQAFVDFVLSSVGQAILAKFGLTAVTHGP